MPLFAAVLIEVGLLSLFQPGEVMVRPQTSRAVTLLAPGHPALHLSGSQSARLRLLNGKLELGGPARLTADELTVQGGFQLSLPSGFRRNFEGELLARADHGQIRLLLHMPVEELVARIVAAESPAGAGTEALRAQAIVSRSWVLASRKRHGAFDVCDTTHCQHFKEATTASTAAAASTRGLILTWESRPFAPAYSASCGGVTKTAREIGWGGEAGYPYFAVECPICQREEKPWRRIFEDYDASTLREHPNAESTRLSFGRRLGWDALPSNHYDLVEEGASLVAEGRGQGHGLGYCQRGGAGLARQGRTAEAILRHYFPGTAVRRVPD